MAGKNATMMGTNFLAELIPDLGVPLDKALQLVHRGCERTTIFTASDINRVLKEFQDVCRSGFSVSANQRSRLERSLWLSLAAIGCDLESALLPEVGVPPKALDAAARSQVFDALLLLVDVVNGNGKKGSNVASVVGFFSYELLATLVETVFKMLRVSLRENSGPTSDAKKLNRSLNKLLTLVESTRVVSLKNNTKTSGAKDNISPPSVGEEDSSASKDPKQEEMHSKAKELLALVRKQKLEQRKRRPQDSTPLAENNVADEDDDLPDHKILDPFAIDASPDGLSAALLFACHDFLVDVVATSTTQRGNRGTRGGQEINSNKTLLLSGVVVNRLEALFAKLALNDARGATGAVARSSLALLTWCGVKLAPTSAGEGAEMALWPSRDLDPDAAAASSGQLAEEPLLEQLLADALDLAEHQCRELQHCREKSADAPRGTGGVFAKKNSEVLAEMGEQAKTLAEKAGGGVTAGIGKGANLLEKTALAKVDALSEYQNLKFQLLCEEMEDLHESRAEGLVLLLVELLKKGGMPLKHYPARAALGKHLGEENCKKVIDKAKASSRPFILDVDLEQFVAFFDEFLLPLLRQEQAAAPQRHHPRLTKSLLQLVSVVIEFLGTDTLIGGWIQQKLLPALLNPPLQNPDTSQAVVEYGLLTLLEKFPSLFLDADVVKTCGQTMLKLLQGLQDALDAQERTTSAEPAAKRRRKNKASSANNLPSTPAFPVRLCADGTADFLRFYTLLAQTVGVHLVGTTMLSAVHEEALFVVARGLSSAANLETLLTRSFCDAILGLFGFTMFDRRADSICGGNVVEQSPAGSSSAAFCSLSDRVAELRTQKQFFPPLEASIPVENLNLQTLTKLEKEFQALFAGICDLLVERHTDACVVRRAAVLRRRAGDPDLMETADTQNFLKSYMKNRQALAENRERGATRLLEDQMSSENASEHSKKRTRQDVEMMEKKMDILEEQNSRLVAELAECAAEKAAELAAETKQNNVRSVAASKDVEMKTVYAQSEKLDFIAQEVQTDQCSQADAPEKGAMPPPEKKPSASKSAEELQSPQTISDQTGVSIKADVDMADAALDASSSAAAPDDAMPPAEKKPSSSKKSAEEQSPKTEDVDNMTDAVLDASSSAAAPARERESEKPTKETVSNPFAEVNKEPIEEQAGRQLAEDNNEPTEEQTGRQLPEDNKELIEEQTAASTKESKPEVNENICKTEEQSKPAVVTKSDDEKMGEPAKSAVVTKSDDEKMEEPAKSADVVTKSDDEKKEEPAKPAVVTKSDDEKMGEPVKPPTLFSASEMKARSVVAAPAVAASEKSRKAGGPTPLVTAEQKAPSPIITAPQLPTAVPKLHTGPPNASPRSIAIAAAQRVFEKANSAEGRARTLQFTPTFVLRQQAAQKKAQPKGGPPAAGGNAADNSPASNASGRTIRPPPTTPPKAVGAPAEVPRPPADRRPTVPGAAFKSPPIVPIAVAKAPFAQAKGALANPFAVAHPHTDSDSDVDNSPWAPMPLRTDFDDSPNRGGTGS